MRPIKHSKLPPQATWYKLLHLYATYALKLDVIWWYIHGSKLDRIKKAWTKEKKDILETNGSKTRDELLHICFCLFLSTFELFFPLFPFLEIYQKLFVKQPVYFFTPLFFYQASSLRSEKLIKKKLLLPHLFFLHVFENIIAKWVVSSILTIR